MFLLNMTNPIESISSFYFHCQQSRLNTHMAFVRVNLFVTYLCFLFMSSRVAHSLCVAFLPDSFLITVYIPLGHRHVLRDRFAIVSATVALMPLNHCTTRLRLNLRFIIVVYILILSFFDEPIYFSLF